MKKIRIYAFILLFIYFVIIYPLVISLTGKITTNFIFVIISSLIPMLFLVNILIKSGIFTYVISKNVILKETLLILLSLLLGLPSNLIILDKLYKNNYISSYKKNLLSSCFGSFSLSYLCYFFLFNAHSNCDYKLFITLLLSEFLVYFFFLPFENNSIKSTYMCLNKEAINVSIKDTVKTLIFIYFSSLFMNLIFAPLSFLYSKNPYFMMLIEFSYAGSFVKTFNFPYRNLMLLIISSLNSISSHFQARYLSSSFSFYFYIKKRTFVLLLNMILFFVFFF